ncbi:hypothetical protein ES5_17049 [Dietzia cinnamea P4]|nr:hypothetical protein ES5_17049 [Dietzia cinnamea P4]
MLLKFDENFPQSDFVLDQGFVVEAGAVLGESACVMGTLADVQSHEYGVVLGHGDTSLLKYPCWSPS